MLRIQERSAAWQANDLFPILLFLTKDVCFKIKESNYPCVNLSLYSSKDIMGSTMDTQYLSHQLEAVLPSGKISTKNAAWPETLQHTQASGESKSKYPALAWNYTKEIGGSLMGFINTAWISCPWQKIVSSVPAESFVLFILQAHLILLRFQYYINSVSGRFWIGG